MCFSAEVSFVASGALTILGIATLRRFSNRHFFFLAAIPLLFAFQQFSEGVLWTELVNGHQNNFIMHLATDTFLVFAFFVWPFWIPFSFFKVEKIKWRQQVLFLIFASGMILSLANLYFALNQNVNVDILNHSIQYSGHLPSQGIVYPLIVISPMFISSMSRVWIFGVLITAAFFITDYFYETTFVSVWCFFAALVSMILYKVLKDNQVNDLDEIASERARIDEKR